MSSFKPGDEVVCVDAKPRFHFCPLVEGHVYVVARVRPALVWPGPVVDLVGISPPGDGFFPERFRKVQRRDLSAWLATATKFEEPKRAPVLQPGDLHAAADAPTGGVALPLAVPGRSNPLPQGASHE